MNSSPTPEATQTQVLVAAYAANLDRAMQLLRDTKIDILYMHTSSSAEGRAAEAARVRALYPHLNIVMLTLAHQGDKLFISTIGMRWVGDNVVKFDGAGTNSARRHDGAYLSERELEVLRLIVSGMTNKEISEKLSISLGTAKAHVRSILTKLVVADRTQAAVEALRRSLI